MVNINEISSLIDESIKSRSSHAYIRIFIDKNGIIKYKQIAIEKSGQLANLPKGKFDSYISITKDNKIILLFQQYSNIEAIRTKAISGRLIKAYIPSIIAKRILQSRELSPGMHRISISKIEEIYDGDKLAGLLLSIGE